MSALFYNHRIVVLSPPFVLVPGDTMLIETQPKSSQRSKTIGGTHQPGCKRPRRRILFLKDSFRGW